jgi:hypothetical protein
MIFSKLWSWPIPKSNPGIVPGHQSGLGRLFFKP